MESAASMVKDEFETAYLRVSLQERLINCENRDVAPLFKRWIPTHQPVLEAGAGAGIWVAWFVLKGWKAVGLEWSRALCVQAKEKIPEAFFVTGDMRYMPFADGAFGSIVALGSIEHLPEGPSAMLAEFKRVLKKDGIAVITVPYHGPLRRFVRLVKLPLNKLRYSPVYRKIISSAPLSGTTLKAVARKTVRGWAVEFHHDEDGWHFYQYQFTARQMRKLLLRAGLFILDESVIMTDSGIYNTLGRFGGTYDPVSGIVTLSKIGKIIKKVLGTRLTGHMLCYVVCKDNSRLAV